MAISQILLLAPTTPAPTTPAPTTQPPTTQPPTTPAVQDNATPCPSVVTDDGGRHDEPARGDAQCPFTPDAMLESIVPEEESEWEVPDAPPKDGDALTVQLE